MYSRIDKQTHAGRLGLGFELWLFDFDFRVSACRGPVIDYWLWCWWLKSFSF